jgi:cytidine deaminase
MSIYEAQWNDLFDRAIAVRERAYARYSHFPVGAALLSSDGSIHVGANVENISFGLTMCAERAAIGNAVARGCCDFVAIAIVAASTQPIVPCGACRQVLAEFGGEIAIRSRALLSGATEAFTLSELLPRPRQGILDSETRST